MPTRTLILIDAYNYDEKNLDGQFTKDIYDVKLEFVQLPSVAMLRREIIPRINKKYYDSFWMKNRALCDTTLGVCERDRESV